MANPIFVEENTLSLQEVRSILNKVTKRDTELNYRSNKAKEFVDNFADSLNEKQKDELLEKLQGLDLTRLREEHMKKIVDFLPTTVDDLRVVLQAYPLSMPKKDQEAIIDVVKGFA
ncbi:hypothetical protein HQ489_03060 [Candidatus Woesearchaeota archaeon]|nr:hypothetical protein [Candidatus Woesearchaeota archaeon]